MHSLLQFIESNSYLLFDHLTGDAQTAMFDSKGFRFSPAAASAYDKIKSQPHLYVAWNESKEGHYYIGKSFQQGGRWKRTHAYHLGTLAYYLLETTRYDDQNHQHWIDAWMVRETLNNRGNGNYSIQLQEAVRIAFIPFHKYHDQDYNRMSKAEIRNINTKAELDLINHFKSLTPPVRLLNVQNNARKTIDKKLKTKAMTIEKTPTVNTIAKEEILYLDIPVNVRLDEYLKQLSNCYCGCCYFIIYNSLDNKQIIYGTGSGKDQPRMVRTEGRFLWEWFASQDTTIKINRPKWEVIQQEARSKGIEKLTIKVWPFSNKQI